MSDPCMRLLVGRAISEMRHATNADIRESKKKALLILIQYGWQDVFKESLGPDGKFKSDEEAGRFNFCLDH